MKSLGRREFAKSLLAMLPIPFLAGTSKANKSQPNKNIMVGDLIMYRIRRRARNVEEILGPFKVYKIESRESRAKALKWPVEDVINENWVYATHCEHQGNSYMPESRAIKI